MKRKEQEKYILNFLKKIELFKNVNPRTLQTIVQNREERTIRSHDFLYYKGEESSYIYIIRYGEIVIENILHGGSVFVGPGDILSETSLILGTPHSTSAYAIIDSFVYAIPGKLFLSLAEKDQALSQNIMKLLSRRMRDHIQGKPMYHSQPRRLYCHIPLDPIPNFRKKLDNLIKETCKLQTIGVSLLNIYQFKEMGLEKFAENLSQIRKKTPQVHLFFENPEQSMDLPAIVLQSDWLIFWEENPDRNAKLKNEILYFWKNRIRNFNGRTLHYQLNASGDKLSEVQKTFFKEDALARFLVAKTRGIALGGGGARALAHIGLIKQLEKYDIQVDYVSGSSFGAVIAAMFARGDKSTEMEKLVERYFGGLESVFDPTLPLVSFFKGKKMRKFLKQVFKDLRIEELPIPFVTSAMDLQSGKEYVFDRGPIVEALIATMSLPGAFPPYILGEKVLVDGGMVNNVPESLIREKGADIVIGVNVSPLQESLSLKIFEDRKSSGKSLFRYIWDTIKYPPILKIMGRTITLEGREITRLKKLKMDLFLNFHLEEFQLFDFARFRDIISKGESEASQYISEILKVFMPNIKIR